MLRRPNTAVISAWSEQLWRGEEVTIPHSRVKVSAVCVGLLVFPLVIMTILLGAEDLPLVGTILCVLSLLCSVLIATPVQLYTIFGPGPAMSVDSLGVTVAQPRFRLPWSEIVAIDSRHNNVTLVSTPEQAGRPSAFFPSYLRGLWRVLRIDETRLLVVPMTIAARRSDIAHWLEWEVRQRRSA